MERMSDMDMIAKLEEQTNQHIKDIDKHLSGRGTDERAVVLLQAKSTALLALATLYNNCVEIQEG
jgi:hypothetical protein